MDIGLAQGVSGMRSTEKRLETITSNIANIGANGFKRQVSTTRTFWVEDGRSRHLEIATNRVTDFKQGPIAHTGNKLDLALNGPGFFAVDTPTGRSYTRDGSFRLDDTGTLMTGNGYPVAWNGSRGKLNPTGEAITIDGSGGVRQGEAQLGKIAIVDFADTKRLTDDALGHYRAPEDMPEQPSTALVEQGSVERSNVEVMDELVEMVFAQRRFENSSSVMRSIEQTYKRLNMPKN